MKDRRYLLLGFAVPIFLAGLFAMSNRAIDATEDKSITWRNTPAVPLSKLLTGDILKSDASLRMSPSIVYHYDRSRVHRDDDVQGVKRVMSKVKLNGVDFEIDVIDCETRAGLDLLLSSWNVSGIIGGFIFDQFNVGQQEFEITIMYNGTHATTLPKLQQILYLAMDSALPPGSGVTPQIYLQEFPKSTHSAVMFMQSAPYQLALGVTVLIPLLTMIVVTEKEKELQHQLMVSGVSLPMYWLSRMFSDWLLYFFIVATQFILVAFVGNTAGASPTEALCFLSFSFII